MADFMYRGVIERANGEVFTSEKWYQKVAPAKSWASLRKNREEINARYGRVAVNPIVRAYAEEAVLSPWREVR